MPNTLANLLSLVLISLIFGAVDTAPLPAHNVRRVVGTVRPRGFVLDEAGGLFHKWGKLNPGDDIVVIGYCYYDQDSYDELHESVDAATKRWHDALGPKRGVKFEAPGQKGDPPIFCKNEKGGWNHEAHLPPGILVLRYRKDDHGAYSSNLGYDPDGDEYRNTLYMDPDSVDVVDDERNSYGAMTHELGHVMGLQHEHQRQDAVDYLTLNCENLDDYEDAKNWINANDPGWTIEQACADADIAYDTNGFSAKGFAPFPKDADDYEYYGDFDIDSIMIYGSLAGSKDSENDKFVLLKKDGDKVIATNMPTKHDVNAVNELYPPLK